MNITSIGSLSSTTSWRSLTNASASSGGTTATARDSATISQAGFAALLQQQQGGPPGLTDAQAADVGKALAEDQPELFQALDTDQDGTLSADELQAGMEALHGGQRQPPGGPPSAMTDADAASIGATMQTDHPKLFSALDTDADGILSADELQAGGAAMHGAMDKAGLQPPPPPEDGAGATTGAGTWSDFEANLMNSILQRLFADSGTTTS